MTARVKNTASPTLVSKALRGAMARFDVTAFGSADMEDLVATHETLLIDVLNVTPRPNEKLLQLSCKEAYEHATKEECKMFGQRVASCFKYVRGMIFDRSWIYILFKCI